MKIQYISDIHLEHSNDRDFSSYLIPNAQYLALCGDIGYPHTDIFRELIEYCSKHWLQVFYITGNHDYYNMIYKRWNYKIPYSMENIEEQIELVFQNYENVHFLQKKTFEIPDTNYVIAGCTLWSHIKESQISDAIQYLNDYNYIFRTDHRFTIEDYNYLHKDHSKWLLDTLKSLYNKKVIVLTHHLPTELLIDPKYLTDPRNFLFYTELSDHLKMENIRLWICGHSHGTRKIVYRPNFEIVMNCKGYPNEKLTHFNKSCIEDLHEVLLEKNSEDISFL